MKSNVQHAYSKLKIVRAHSPNPTIGLCRAQAQRIELLRFSRLPYDYLRQMTLIIMGRRTILQPVYYMLSYITKKVNKAYEASKKVIAPEKEAYKATPAYKLIRSLEKYGSEVLPATKLQQLAGMSYDYATFELMLAILLRRIEEYRFDGEPNHRLKQFRNTLIICSYLVKHGAGGFVDEFRDEEPKLERLVSQNSYPLLYGYEALNAKTTRYVEENINRARYLLELLRDKEKLLLEKKIAMMVKQKLRVKEKENMGQTGNFSSDPAKEQDKNEKVDSFLENYVWKYISIIDGKLDKVADALADKIEKYLVEDMPESFEIDELQKTEHQIRTEADLGEAKLRQEESFINKRQNTTQQQPKPVVQDLLSL